MEAGTKPDFSAQDPRIAEPFDEEHDIPEGKPGRAGHPSSGEAALMDPEPPPRDIARAAQGVISVGIASLVEVLPEHDALRLMIVLLVDLSRVPTGAGQQVILGPPALRDDELPEPQT